MSKPVKKRTRTRKSLGRGSRWQKGTLAGIQNRDVQTSDFLVLGQGRPWAGASGTGKKGEPRGVHRVGGTQVGFFICVWARYITSITVYVHDFTPRHCNPIVWVSRYKGALT